MLRPLLVLLALLGAMLSHAGSFLVEDISGGTGTYTNGTTTRYSGYFDGSYGIQYPMVGCGGTITATLKWQSDARTGSEPAPPKAIVWQGCIAKQGLGGACDNDLDDPLVGDQRGEAAPAGSGNPIFHPVVKTPDANGRITVTLTPTASAAETSPGATIRYWVHANALKIDLTGVVNPWTDKRTAIGCNVGATVSGAPYLSSFTWSVSGGNPFSHYEMYESYGRVHPWLDTGQSSTAAVFKEEGAAQFSCRIQNATYGIDVTLYEFVGLEKPSYSTPLDDIGSFVIGRPLQGPQIDVFRLYNSSTGHGKDLHQIVIDPPVITALNLGSSAIADIQLLNADYSSTPASSPLPVNGSWVLDTYVPYVSGQANPLGTTQGANILRFADSPGLDDIQYFTQIKHKASARIYLMYRPSVITAGWVTIAREEWSWDGQISRANTTSAWGPIYNNNSNGSMTDFHEHPIWEKNIDPDRNPPVNP